jgi:hypothetical protein
MSVQLGKRPVSENSKLLVARRGFRCEKCKVGTVAEQFCNNRPVHKCDFPECGEEYPNLVV